MLIFQSPQSDFIYYLQRAGAVGKENTADIFDHFTIDSSSGALSLRKTLLYDAADQTTEYKVCLVFL